MALNDKIFEAVKTILLQICIGKQAIIHSWNIDNFANSFPIDNAVIESGSSCLAYYIGP